MRFNSSYKIQYSTPEDYLQAVKKCEWPISKNESWDPDMYPYNDGNFVPWTGFFTSRPNLKKGIIDFNAQFYASA